MRPFCALDLLQAVHDRLAPVRPDLSCLISDALDEGAEVPVLREPVLLVRCAWCRGALGLISCDPAMAGGVSDGVCRECRDASLRAFRAGDSLGGGGCGMSRAFDKPPEPVVPWPVITGEEWRRALRRARERIRTAQLRADSCEAVLARVKRERLGGSESGVEGGAR